MTVDRILCGEEIALWRIEKSRQRQRLTAIRTKKYYICGSTISQSCAWVRVMFSATIWAISMK